MTKSELKPNSVYYSTSISAGVSVEREGLYGFYVGQPNSTDGLIRALIRMRFQQNKTLTNL